MVLTAEQVKWLMQSDIDPTQYHFYGSETAPEKDREQLRKLDADYFEIYGRHLVDNPDEI